MFHADKHLEINFRYYKRNLVRTYRSTPSEKTKQFYSISQLKKNND